MAVIFYCPICGVELSRHAATTLSAHWAEWKQADKRDEIGKTLAELVLAAPKKNFWFGYGRPDV